VPDTGVDVDTLRRIGRASVTLPSDFTPHSRVQRSHIEPRLKAIESGTLILPLMHPYPYFISL
jgi:probable 2-oxoglutarate dehydrogenase E1 component DHKTD1